MSMNTPHTIDHTLDHTKFEWLLNDQCWAQAFEQVFYFVEANDNERHMLWCHHHRDHVAAVKRGTPEGQVQMWAGPALDWSGNAQVSGRMVQLGKIDGRPVTLCLSFHEINKQLICFYDSPSQVTDHAMIERWFASHGFGPKHNQKGQFTNGMNFSHVVNALRALKVKYSCTAQYVDTCLPDYLRGSAGENEALLYGTPAGQEDAHELACQMVEGLFDPDIPDEIEDSAIIEALAKALDGVDLRPINADGFRVEELADDEEGSDSQIYVVLRWEREED